MSKKVASIIQTKNDIENKYEYSVKGYDVTESIETLLSQYKQQLLETKINVGSVQGYLEARREYEKQIEELKTENERLKNENNILQKNTYSYFRDGVNAMHEALTSKVTYYQVEKMNLDTLKKTLDKIENRRKQK